MVNRKRKIQHSKRVLTEAWVEKSSCILCMFPNHQSVLLRWVVQLAGLDFWCLITCVPSKKKKVSGGPVLLYFKKLGSIKEQIWKHHNVKFHKFHSSTYLIARTKPMQRNAAKMSTCTSFSSVKKHKNWKEKILWSMFCIQTKTPHFILLPNLFQVLPRSCSVFFRYSTDL